MDKIFVSKTNFHQFCPTNFCQTRYAILKSKLLVFFPLFKTTQNHYFTPFLKTKLYISQLKNTLVWYFAPRKQLIFSFLDVLHLFGRAVIAFFRASREGLVSTSCLHLINKTKYTMDPRIYFFMKTYWWWQKVLKIA